MTKAQIRDVKMAESLVRVNMIDTAARCLSAAIRAAMRSKDAAELRQHAIQLGLTSHPDFIC